MVWYQQTDPHRAQRDSLHFMTVDAITFPAQPEVSGLHMGITWLCNTALRNVAVVSQTKVSRAVSFVVLRRAAKSSHSCALRRAHTESSTTSVTKSLLQAVLTNRSTVSAIESSWDRLYASVKYTEVF
jgi:hypothetical protein